MGGVAEVLAEARVAGAGDLAVLVEGPSEAGEQAAAGEESGSPSGAQWQFLIAS